MVTWLRCSETIAFGCNALLNSSNAFLIITKWRMTLTPPDVEPDEPPKKKRPKKSMVRKGVQPAKSAVTNPVVVIIATT